MTSYLCIADICPLKIVHRLIDYFIAKLLYEFECNNSLSDDYDNLCQERRMISSFSTLSDSHQLITISIADYLLPSPTDATTVDDKRTHSLLDLIIG